MTAFLSASCEKELDFRYHDIPPLTVIEATLTPGRFQATATLTVPMDEPLSEAPVLTDARMTLTDMADGKSVDITAGENGFYETPVATVTGRRYRLVAARGGVLHTAETELYGPVKIISAEFNWIKMPYDDVAVLQCRYADDPQSDGQCYWVRVYRNGEIYMWGEQSDRTAEDGLMTFFAMTSRRDLDEEDEQTALRDGDEIRIDICQISREMHDYLEAIANDSNGPAMFTTTSSESTPSDSYESAEDVGPCLGYFLAATLTSTTLTFYPDEIPYASPKHAQTLSHRR